uniref:Beta-defensin n=1 Tax=Aquila chrysaetos chrysaetos TaxID=223781 RepID=A0A663EEJ3_AQUCH
PFPISLISLSISLLSFLPEDLGQEHRSFCGLTKRRCRKRCQHKEFVLGACFGGCCLNCSLSSTGMANPAYTVEASELLPSLLHQHKQNLQDSICK